MVADVNLCVPRCIRIRRVSDIREIDIIDDITVVAHDCTVGDSRRRYPNRRGNFRLVQRDVRRRRPCLLHREVEYRIRAVVDFSVSPSLIDF